MRRKYNVEGICPTCSTSRLISKYGIRDRLCRSCSYKSRTRSVKDRFWEKVDVKNKNECWIWNSTTDKNGYGIFKLGNKDVKAHRVSWEFHSGSIPLGMQILHKCDNPPCINPNHLFLGTPQDNMDDKKKKGRSVYFKGSQLPQSKLEDSQVIDIWNNKRHN